MADPENIVLEHLRAIRGKLDEIERKVDSLDESKAGSAQVADLDLKLTGLAHAVMSGFGSAVYTLDPLNERVSRLENESI